MFRLYHDRPLNIRYVVHEHSGRYTPELLRAHHTARASWLYIHRQHGIDTFGPTPDWSLREDLVAHGRSAPARAGLPSLDGLGLWDEADDTPRASAPASRSARMRWARCRRARA